RRHTIWPRDWSSDVCSSDLSLSCTSGSVANDDTTASEADPANFTVSGYTGDPTCTATEFPVTDGYTSTATCSALLSVGQCTITKIGRASCRERVEIEVVGGG